MRTSVRIVRFLAYTALDVLLPDFIDVPLKICQNVYVHFLAADPRQKLELLREAETLADGQADEAIDDLMEHWKPLLPPGGLSASQRGLLRRVLHGLHRAGRAPVDPAEAVRTSLNDLLAGGPALSSTSLRPEQHAVGGSLYRAAQRGSSGGVGRGPLPPEAPTVPGYSLLRVLGRGSSSVVYLAVHLGTNDVRAVKIRPAVEAARFRREVALLAKLTGPHVVRYHEHGEAAGHYWIALEYLGEHTLADLLRGRPTTEQALLLAEQLLRGLATLHAAGVVHRDLKPENALVDDQLCLRLIDFGLAKPLLDGPAARNVGLSGGLIGTPLYVSPEQIRDVDEVTRAADLWAFGCVLFELLAGRPLFESNNVMALGHEILTKKVRFDAPEIPPELRNFLDRCLKRDPAERWQEAGAALDEFATAAASARRRMRRKRHREAWEAARASGVVTRFATEARPTDVAEGVLTFLDLARREGVEGLDEEVLGEVLAPLVARQRAVAQAEEALALAKSRLLAEADSASRGEPLPPPRPPAPVDEPTQRRQRVRDKVNGTLEMLNRWEEKRRSPPPPPPPALESEPEPVAVREEAPPAPPPAAPPRREARPGHARKALLGVVAVSCLGAVAAAYQWWDAFGWVACLPALELAVVVAALAGFRRPRASL